MLLYLTRRDRDKVASILQTAFLNALIEEIIWIAMNKIEKYELFSENPEDLKLIYQKLTTTMEKLENV